MSVVEKCGICGCSLHRTRDTYARPNVLGRSHATEHHFVAERFFGRSNNRRGTKTEGVFESCPWGHEKESIVFCYECHEELIHNPVFLPRDIEQFAKLVQERGLSENEKPKDRSKIGGRIKLLHEVIESGLAALAKKAKASDS